jgi:hypothetical protein
LRDLLAESTGPEAQLLLSYLVWPKEAPDPRVVDEWIRRTLPGSEKSGDSTGTAPFALSG